MRHTFLLLLLFAGSAHSFFAQEAEKLKKYQSTVSKHTYSKGDTIIVGETGKNVFSAQKKYAAIFIKDKKNVCGYRELDSVISGTPCIIRNILSFKEHCTFEFKNSVVFELQGPNNHTLYMPIDKALQAKELIVFTNPAKTSTTDWLDEKNVFLLNLEQFKGSSADNALKYCKIVDPRKGKQYDLNANQFDKEKTEWVKKLDSARKKVHLRDTFLISLPAYLGKYSADKGEFQVVDDPSVYGSKPLKYTSDSKIQFDNFKNFNTLKSPRENADFFLNVNTPDYNGNRKAYAKIKVICTSVTKDPTVAITADNPGINILHLTVIEISMVDSENQQYNYIGTKKTK
jgi:hypothetical protein